MLKDESILSIEVCQIRADITGLPPRAFSTRATFQPLGPFLRKKGTWLSAKFPLSIEMVPKGGFEPPRVSPPPPQAALPLTSDYNHFVYRIVTTASA